jgi:hypothetical protein
MKTTPLSKLLFFASLSALAGCAVEPQSAERTGDDTSALATATSTTLTTTTTVATTDDTYVARLGQPSQQLVASGTDWQRLLVSGSVLTEADDGTVQTVNEDLLVLSSPTAVSSAPIPAMLKPEIEATIASLPANEQAGAIIVNLGAVKSYEAEMQKAKTQGVMYLWPSCNDVDKVWTKTFTKGTSFNYTQSDETGSFQGNIALSGSASGSVTANVTLRLDKKWIPLAGCTTFWGYVKRAQLTGVADVTGRAKAAGKFEKEWHKSKTVIEPTIYDDWVSIGGLPVKVKVTLPIEAGIDASARVDFDADVGVTGHGSFDVSCTSSSCSATKSATWNWADNKVPTLGLNARAKISPWVQPNVKLDLYYGAASGKIGLRATLNNDLWGYYGNTCGDANGDGVNEWVSAATLDARLALDLRARVALFGAGKDFAWNLADYHVGFFDLIGSSAMDPIWQVASSNGTSYTMKGRMRPCWPYTQTMRYVVDWGDGSAPETVNAAPGTFFTKSHTFPSYVKTYATKSTAVVDTAGHDPNRTTTRSVRPSIADVNTGGILVR